MEEIVSSAIVGETVNRIMSRIIGKDEDKSNQNENIERLEMAHIKMEAVLQVSNNWQITEVPLLRWRSKLKRAAQECDDTLRKCKQHALEGDETKERMRQSSFPKRVAHATMSLISSFIENKDESSNSSANVQRFERYAKGANEFLRTIEFGGTPRRYTFFDPLIRHLLTGKSVKYRAFQDDKLYFFNIQPFSSAERGVETLMDFACHDFKEPTKGFYVACMLRLSESMNIFDVIIKCVLTFAPHFKFVAEGLIRGLSNLPTQDFSWDFAYQQSEVCVNVQNTLTEWQRPNPICCNEQWHHQFSSSTTSNMIVNPWKLSNMFPEKVINLLLKWHVPLLSDRGTNNTNSTAVHGQSTSQNSDIPTLNLAVLVIPHEPTEDMQPAFDSYVLEVIDGKEQGAIHTNAHLQHLGEVLLPKAIEYLHQNSESETYQMSLKSRHGTAHICLEKSRLKVQTDIMVQRQATTHAQNKMATVRQDIEQWKQVLTY